MEKSAAISFWGRFVAPDTEDAYRNWQIRDDTRRIRLTIGFTIPVLVVFIVTDYYFFGPSASYFWLVGMRVLFAVASLFVMLRLHDNIEPWQLDRLVFGWDTTAALLVVYIASTRPATYTNHAVINVLTILLIYVIIPLPMWLQIIPAGIISLGLIILGIYVNPWPDQPVTLTVLMGILVANVLGAVVSRELHVWKRRQFLTLSHEIETRLSLEQALAEIKTLRGILPICTHCKRIWNDSGFWEQVEVYVHQHTHAEFSHGLCPTCARQHYPEIDWDKKGL